MDAVSDDGRYGLTIIAMLGSVFSPYYARARARGRADPLDHCGLNVALYGRRARRWSLTERGRGALARGATHLRIGPSGLHWAQDCLHIDIDEVTVPIPARLRGRVRLYPEALSDYQAALDAAGRHRWTPIAPCARVEVAMTHPALRWAGPAYLDANAGEEPLEAAFRGWHWSRSPHRGGTSVLYHTDARAGGGARLAIHFDGRGEVSALPPLLPAPLPATRIWRIPRGTHADPEQPARVVATLEDTPFYARSLVRGRIQGEDLTAFHESLSLERFRQRWVKLLLPFRMPRVPGGG